MQDKIDIFLKELLSEISPKAKSLIITFFGDSVFPYGGTIWLGSLIKFMQDFEISEKLTRTSTFRLAKEGWLSSNKFGRESYYSLNDFAIDNFLKANYSIYGYDKQEEDDDWIVLFTNSLNSDDELELSKIIKKEGFANPSKQVYFHPNYKMENIQDILIKTKTYDKILLIKGPSLMPLSKEKLKDFAYSYWDLAGVEQKYQDFISKFIKIYSLKVPFEEFSPKQSFILRTLLIHEYRRALLFDPKLGNELVSINWLGKSATSLVESVYLQIHKKANEYINENFTSIANATLKLDPFYKNRFGGI